MKGFLFLSIFALFMLVSCESSQNANENLDAITASQKMTLFSLKLDSLSNAYSRRNTINSTRGVVSDYTLGAAADAVGGYVGSKLFSWVGSAIGAAMGNPVVAVGGYVVGRKFGKAACSTAASLGTAWILSKRKSRTNISSTLMLDDNYVVSIENPNNLSDGELHNLILVKLIRNIEKYEMSDNTLNYELILEDAYNFENEYLPSEENDLYKAISMSKAVEQIKRIVNSSILLEAENEKVFLDDVYNSLIPEVKVSKAEFDNANILSEKLLKTYIILDSNTASELEKEVDYVIDTSNLDVNLKTELKGANSILKNSSTIWKEVK